MPYQAPNGSTYNYSSTSSGQGNWNTGGSPTGRGSMDNGITGITRRYDVAPTNPRALAGWQQHIARRDARLGGQPGGPGGGPRSAIPVQQPMPVAPVPPAQVAPSAYPVPNYPPVPMSRLQNYLMEMAAYNKSRQQQITPAAGNFSSTFNARPGATTRIGIERDPYGNDQFGSSFGGFGQRTQQGTTGGGRGGGGGGFY